MREEVLALRQSHEFKCLSGAHDHRKRTRVCVSNIFTGKYGHAPEEEPRVLPALEHLKKPDKCRICITPAHTLNECRDGVVVILSALVVPLAALLKNLLRLSERDVLPDGEYGKFQTIERDARITTGNRRQVLHRLLRHAAVPAVSTLILH